MKILDYFEHPKFGVIVSTANPEFDNLSNDEIKKRIGDEIIILDADSHKKKSVKVSGIELANSLIGKKNINICLSDSIKLSDITPNSEILREQDPETIMKPDPNLIGKIYNAFDPFEPLLPGDPAYVECGEVRGDSNIQQDLGRKIILANSPTCQLYAGHRGGGKSTELLRLQKYLEENNCFVVYFSADEEDIDSEDAQYTDILLACTRHLLQDLRDSNPDPILHWLRDRWEDLKGLALTTAEFDNVSVETAITTFAKITADLRAVPSQRAKIRKLVDPHTTTLLKALNEFIDEAQNQLPLGKTKLVIIADSLEKITPTIQEDGRTNHDHIFIERSKQLKGLDCHVVYTVPISLLYSNRANDLYDNYGDTTILPMIMVQKPDDNSPYQPGLDKLKEIIDQRIKKINPTLNLETDIFENETILERLCMMIGGHVRQLMQLIQESISNIGIYP